MHDRVYAVRDEASEVECVNWRGRIAIGLGAKPQPNGKRSSARKPKPAASRPAYFGQGKDSRTPVFRGLDLKPGDTIIGPAIVEEPTTTIVVYPKTTSAGQRIRSLHPDGVRSAMRSKTPAAKNASSSAATKKLRARPQELSEDDAGARRRAPRRAAKPAAKLDPVVLTVIANRLDGIVREMTNTLLRAARSAVISSARDFSCCIITGDNQLLASAEGLPVHIFGAHLQGANIAEYHKGDIREGDAFLDNDPYGGNTHPADHTFLVPVFIEGEHLFTTVAKCHMADIGNSIPSSYFARALDVYEEGALVFPGVRIQRDYKNEADIIRMCRARIRVPDQWYGDSLAALGSARIAERRLKELCAKYGRATIKALHARLVRLFRTAHGGGDPQAAEGEDREYRLVGSARRHPAGRSDAEGQARYRSEGGDGSMSISPTIRPACRAA